MNYFVISTVMRFIFNNCNNYFIKKRSHALWLSRQGLKLEGILIKSIILPPVCFQLDVPLKLHQVSTMFVFQVSSSIYRGQRFHSPADTRR